MSPHCGKPIQGDFKMASSRSFFTFSLLFLLWSLFSLFSFHLFSPSLCINSKQTNCVDWPGLLQKAFYTLYQSVHMKSKTAFVNVCGCHIPQSRINFSAAQFLSHKQTKINARPLITSVSFSISASTFHQQFPASSRALDSAADWQLPAAGAHLQAQRANGPSGLRPPSEKSHPKLLFCFWSWWVTQNL